MDLRIQKLSKRYPNGVQALKDVTLNISAGMFGLLGPNGAGKSTLMRTLATLQEADSGSATLDGVDMLRDKDKVRRMLGYLPQEFGVYPKVSALEMLEHFAVLKGLSNARQRTEVVKGLLKKTNLYDARHRKLGTYSGGMKQRFGIAQALLGDPKLIIVDEPTAGLDPEERVRFHNLLGEIGENIIVILSTHIVGDVADLCRQMAVINRGQVVTAGDPLQLTQQLSGKVWKRLVGKEDVAGLESRYQVLSTRRMAGQVLVRVYADAAPDASFERAEPELEDTYFVAIKGFAPGNGADARLAG